MGLAVCGGYCFRHSSRPQEKGLDARRRPRLRMPSQPAHLVQDSREMLKNALPSPAFVSQSRAGAPIGPDFRTVITLAPGAISSLIRSFDYPALR